MPDERPALDPVEELAQLRADFEDLKNTMLIRVARQPTGSIEPTLRTSPMADTLFLQGQTLNRADYPGLWQWVQDLSLLGTGLFDDGNGTTTFVIPDFRGRLVVGAGQLGSDNYAVGAKAGAATKVITPGNMANHTHQVQVANHSFDVGSETAPHGHPSVGDHVHASHGHSSAIPRSDGGSTNVGPVLTSSQVGGGGGHYHGNNGNGHEHYFYISPHSIAETVVGQSIPLDIRAPYIALNWMIWT